MINFVCYARVSDAVSQGVDGLGIDAQLHSMRSYVERLGTGRIVAEYVEAESGANDHRERLLAAIATARRTGAKILIARLDRISRDAAFILSLRKSGVDFVCADMPEADSFQISLYAILAQRERELISLRTKLALQAAKRRGVRLGARDPARQVALMAAANRNRKIDFAARVRPEIESIRATGVSTLQGIADCLNRRGIATPRGRTWHPASVRNLLAT